MSDLSEAAAEVAAGGGVRRAALRMFIRRSARKAARAGDHDTARTLRSALDNDDALDSVLDALDAEGLAPPPSGDGAIVDQIIKLLQWFVDHADEIIAIVMKIIPLFMV